MATFETMRMLSGEELAGIKEKSLEYATSHNIGAIEAESILTAEKATGQIGPSSIDKEISRRYQGFWDELGRNVVSGSMNVATGVTGTVGRGFEGLAKNPLARIMDRLVPGSAFFVDEKVSKPIQDTSEKIFKKSHETKFQPAPGGGVPGYIAQAVGQTLPYMAAAVGSTLATGSPLAAFGVGFSVEGENAYREAINLGMTESEAQMQSVVVGTISGVIETFQVGEIFKRAGLNAATINLIKKAASERALKKLALETGNLTLGIVQSAINEGIQESLQETVSVVAPAISGKEIDLDGAFNRISKAFVGGATVGGILSGATVPFNLVNGEPVQLDTEGAPLTQEQVVEQEVQIAEKQAVKETQEKRLPVRKSQTEEGVPPLETQTTELKEVDNSVIKNEAEGKPPFPKVTSPRQDKLIEDRKILGQEIPSKESQTFAQWETEAIEQNIPQKARRISEEVNTNPRPMTPQESAGLTIALKDLKIELTDLYEQVSQTEDADQLTDFAASIERLEAEHDIINKAVFTSGSERGRALASQKYAINNEGDIVTMKARARANKRAPLTKEENIVIEEKVRILNEKNDKLEAEIKRLQEEQASDVMVKKTKKKKQQQDKDHLASMIEEARQLLEEGCIGG